MADLSTPDSEGPFHLVNMVTGKHIGPFTTAQDAVLASQITAHGDRWEAKGKTEFDHWLWPDGARE